MKEKWQAVIQSKESINMDSRKRFPHIDLIETIAIIFVVFVHSPLYQLDFLDTDINKHCVNLYYCRYFIRTIFSTCVPLFFFANGYLLFSKPYNSAKHFKRTTRIVLLPIFGLILHPIYMVIAGQKIDWKLIIIDWLNLTTEWTMNVFWFAGALACVYFLFPALKSLYDNDNKVFVKLIIVIFTGTFGIKLCNILLFLINNIIGFPVDSVNYPIIEMYIPFRPYGYSFVFFCLGGIAYRYEDTIRIISKTKRNVFAYISMFTACLLLFGIGVLLSDFIGSRWDVVWEGYDTIPTLVNVIAIYLFSLNYTSNNKIIEFISKNTLGIYLLHYLVIRLTRPFIKSIPIFQNIPANILYSILVVLACVAIIEGLRQLPKLIKLT